jgi:hypothetical protein
MRQSRSPERGVSFQDAGGALHDAEESLQNAGVPLLGTGVLFYNAERLLAIRGALPGEAYSLERSLASAKWKRGDRFLTEALETEARGASGFRYPAFSTEEFEELRAAVATHVVNISRDSQGLTIPAESLSFLRDVLVLFDFKTARLEMRLERKGGGPRLEKLKFSEFRFMFEDHDGASRGRGIWRVWRPKTPPPGCD